MPTPDPTPSAVELFYTWVETPIGPFFVAGSEDRVHQMSFSTGHQVRRPDPGWTRGRAPLEKACRQVEEYFDGSRRVFDLELAMEGTEFLRSVWRALQTIPFGETRSYGEIGPPDRSGGSCARGRCGQRSQPHSSSRPLSPRHR